MAIYGEDQDEQIESAFAQVRHELELMARGDPIRIGSDHEGYALILERLDDAWSDIKFGEYERAQNEIVRVAAMAVRYLIDVGK